LGENPHSKTGEFPYFPGAFGHFLGAFIPRKNPQNSSEEALKFFWKIWGKNPPFLLHNRGPLKGGLSIPGIFFRETPFKGD